MLSLISYLPNLEPDQVMSNLQASVPEPIYELISGTVYAILSQREGGILGFGLLASLWSGSKRKVSVSPSGAAIRVWRLAAREVPVAFSTMVRMLSLLRMPRPEPIGAASGIEARVALQTSGGTFHLLDLTPEPDPNDPDLRRFQTDREGLQRELFERLKGAIEDDIDVQLTFPRQHITGFSLEYMFRSPVSTVFRLEASYTPNAHFAGMSVPS